MSDATHLPIAALHVEDLNVETPNAWQDYTVLIIYWRRFSSCVDQFCVGVNSLPVPLLSFDRIYKGLYSN